MLADGLTKKGASSEELMTVLQTGRFHLAGGWKINDRQSLIPRTWVDMNVQPIGDDIDEENSAY